MTFNFVWKLDSGILLASDSKSTIFQGEEVTHRKTQKTFKINCHFPLGALSCGSTVIGENPVTTMLTQNYNNERNSVEGYSNLFDEELREALKSKHNKIETTNFAIHLAGFCPQQNSYKHYLLSTTKNVLNAPREVKEPLFVGGTVKREEIEILKQNGISKNKADLSIGKAASILVKALEEIYQSERPSLVEPTQLLMIETHTSTWIKGPFKESIIDML